ncbi:hypothetical protein F511_01466 [Dorcoceras hygrometricum]|uniref:Uncharacterized protein n=1 Tax=Dorcoceras hygrometricum TaxID=472368 RepID=A0A2Z7BFR0_9LAMI|nr:hypothetical protein F511_01466 [Dorcoceras hygrometricum]
MDNSCPLILEISSDEESGFVDGREGDYAGDGNGFGDREDHDWLSKLLGEVDGKKEDDSDEVLLVSEVIVNPKKPRLRPSKQARGIVCNKGGEDDDDCVILDCESGQAKVVENHGVDNHGGGGDSYDSDDLEIVGEKGEVACRDFPHARHLCANFVFASTPHDIHCSQCHCYVCDSIAPCAHWGTGMSSSDHCHANDREDYWKTERKRAKKGDQPVSALPGTIDTFFSAGLPQTTQVPALLPLLPNLLLQQPASQQVPCRPGSRSSTVNVPVAINRHRNHLAGRVIPRYKTYPQYSSQRSPTTWRSDTTSVGNNSNLVNRGPQLIHRPAFKRPGFVEARPNSRHVHNRRYHWSQVSGGFPLKRCPGFNRNSSNHQKNTLHCAANSVLLQPNFLVPQSMNVGSTNYIHSHPQVYAQPTSSYVVGGPTHSQHGMPSQPYLGDNFENGLPFHSPVSSQSNLEIIEDTVPPLLNEVFQHKFPIPSQSMLSQLGSNNEQMHPAAVITSPSNQSSQFQEFGEHESLHTNPQNNHHQSSQAQSVVIASHADIGVNWDTSLSHNNIQISSEVSQLPCEASADNFQYQSITENDCSIVLADSCCPVSVPSANCRLLGTDKDSHFPISQDPDSLNFCFDNWIMENQYFPADLSMSPMSPGLTVFSPAPASIDAGTHFDF